MGLSFSRAYTEGQRHPHYDIFIDSTKKLGVNDVIQKFNSGDFKRPDEYIGLAEAGNVYWVRFPLKDALPNHLLEINGYINSICVYHYDQDKTLKEECAGFNTPIALRLFAYPNALFYLPDSSADGFIYIELRSRLRVSVGLAMQPFHYFLNRSVNRTFGFGMFIGICLIVGIYNLILFFRLLEKVYLFYSLYLFSFACFTAFMSAIGIFLLYRFDWTFAFLTFPFSLMTIFLLLYSKYFFKRVRTFPYFDRVVDLMAVARVLLFIVAQVFNLPMFNLPIYDHILLVPPLIAGICGYYYGARFSIYFLLGYSAIFLAYFFHTFINIPYAMYYLGTLEIILFSFSISERFRMLKTDNELEHLKTIELQKGMLEKSQENESLKDQMNANLSQLVEERTKTIQIQAEEIQRMNALLKIDNESLKENITEISKARLSQKLMSFDEFCNNFSDDTACLSFLADYKSRHYKFFCPKCKHLKYSEGYKPFSRRCSKCGTVEMATQNTIFFNIKFPYNKAFYLVYALSSNKTISNEKLAKDIDLRPGTSANFSNKVKEIVSNASRSRLNKEGWTSLIFTQ